MAMEGTLKSRNGKLYVLYTSDEYSEPFRQYLWWRVLETRGTGYGERPEAGDVATSSGGGEWRTRNPSTHRSTGTVSTGTGSTQAETVERVSINPPPAGGKELRWREGRWEKLMAKGWVPAGEGKARTSKSSTNHSTAKRHHSTKRHQATKKSPAQLQREIDEALSQAPGMTTEQIERYRGGRKWGWPADLAFKAATGRPLSRTPGRRAHATMRTQKMPSFKISTKDPAAMTAAEINKELDKLNEQDSTLGSLMIEAGRGHERPSEYLKMTDPLAMELRKNSDRRQDLRIEISLRYGPNPPSRLPSGRGFGPRSKTQSPTRGGMGFGKRFGGD